MATNGGDESSGDKTERATPRRRQEAEREGRIPRSRELSGAAVLVAATVTLGSAGAAAIGRETTQILRANIGGMTAEPMPVSGAVSMLQTTGYHMLLGLAPFLLVVTATAVVINAVQARGIISFERITPKLSNLDPRQGLKRIIGLQGAFTLVKSLAKLIVLGCVAWVTLHGAWPQLTGLAAADITATIVVLRTLSMRLVFHVGLAYLVIAAGDYAFEVYRFEQDIRMSKQDIKREYKESDGDPMIKGRIRALMRALSRKRMLHAVAKADVVITNPTHIAVALKYDTAVASAPIVVAIGERKLAERIKWIARQHSVPCIENKPLARALKATAVVGYPIPAALYAAVAEVLAWVYKRRAVGIA